MLHGTINAMKWILAKIGNYIYIYIWDYNEIKLLIFRKSMALFILTVKFFLTKQTLLYAPPRKDRIPDSLKHIFSSFRSSPSE